MAKEKVTDLVSRQLEPFLAENGYEMQQETLVQDGSFLYTVLTARWDGEKRTLSPGEQFVSPQLRAENSPLLDAYIQRVENALRATVEGLHGAEHPRPERLAYHEAALREIEEMREHDAEGQ